jgi:hypothetical protein
VGWSRNDLSRISQLAEQNANIAKIPVFQPGEQIPEFKAG